MRLKTAVFTGLATLALMGLLTLSADATVVVGGTNKGSLITGLNTMGVTYTNNLSGSTTVDPTGYGAGDTILISNDGGTSPTFADYNNFLNAGGHLVMMGGSNFQPFRDFVANYFLLTDTGSGWHTDGSWHKDGSNPVTVNLPSNYTFTDGSATFHMLGFLAAANTVLLGHNDEPNSIAAVRSYANGGSFTYMALDIGGSYGGNIDDQSQFLIPFLRGALNPAAAVPEPASLLAAAIGVLIPTGLAIARRKRSV